MKNKKYHTVRTTSRFNQKIGTPNTHNHGTPNTHIHCTPSTHIHGNPNTHIHGTPNTHIYGRSRHDKNTSIKVVEIVLWIKCRPNLPS